MYSVLLPMAQQTDDKERTSEKEKKKKASPNILVCGLFLYKCLMRSSYLWRLKMHLIWIFNRWLIDAKNTLADCKSPLIENQ